MNKSIARYKHVIWDWNGTILNDVELCVDVGNNLFRKKNIPLLTVEKYKDIFTIPVRDYYIAAGFDFEIDSFEVVGKEWMDEFEERKYECSLHDGLTNVMDRFNKLGVGQSILSAYMQDNLEAMVDKFNLNKYLDHVIGLDNIYAASKLHLGKELMKTLGNGHGETVLIGDTVHDHDVAKEIGSDCILIADGHQPYKILEETGSKVYNTLEEFLNYII